MSPAAQPVDWCASLDATKFLAKLIPKMFGLGIIGYFDADRCDSLMAVIGDENSGQETCLNIFSNMMSRRNGESPVEDIFYLLRRYYLDLWLSGYMLKYEDRLVSY
ncbi:hypothetical protein [Glaciimonas soli]|uniref:hypothetical protein n=1 Tax=Glaciimonas soli TaxID=2590999 RepID=UPI001884FCF6|nr:hypothetical protein [Glaciimonas soli]